MVIKNDPVNDNNIIYKTPCKHGSHFYIGHTGKSLQSRVTRYKYSVRNARVLQLRRDICFMCTTVEAYSSFDYRVMRELLVRC